MEQGNEIECYETLQWDVNATEQHEYLDQIDSSNLIYMTEDGQTIGIGDLIEEDSATDDADSQTVVQDVGGEELEIVATEEYAECEVTEEIITNDWAQGEECVQVTVDQIGSVQLSSHIEEDDMKVPLPEAQDEYTASRPYPCDFCSRRFRKKANLMNHMIAHQNDRPHVCNLCGTRYIRKSDLLNHLKTHAYTEDGYDGGEDHDLVNFLEDELNYGRKINIDLEELLASPTTFSAPTQNNRQKRQPNHKSNVRTNKNHQTFNRNSTKKVKKKPKPSTKMIRTPIKKIVEPEQELPVKFPVLNPDKPFVCQHCGVAFARSKALTSHTRVRFCF